jgi:hypothetical protein
MLQTDLNGFINEVKKNKTCHLILLILVCIIIYYLVSKYVLHSKNNFNNVNGGIQSNILLGSMQDSCKGDIPKIDEAIIRNMIELPNRNPTLLTSSMVVPEITTSDEERRRTRMGILNMFYSSFDDDLISYNKRPKGLYLTP